MTDLGKFGPEVISVACGQWRVREAKRPTIADIHRLCLDEEEQRQATDPELAERIKHDRERRGELRSRRDLEMQLEGRELINKWAREKGYSDVDAYATARGVHWTVIYGEHIRGVLANAPALRGIQSTAAALGVTVREYTPSEMSQARTELGMEE